MPSELYQYFTNDHRRLEGLLAQATAIPGKIDDVAYSQFRAGLLRHIGLEERILLPAAQKLRGGEPIPIASKLRLDHGAIVALLAPPPSPTIVAALRAILKQHDLLEESPGGAYEICEQLVGDDMDSLMNMIRNAPNVPTNPYNPKPHVLDGIRRTLARAGYNFDDYQPI
jgi:hypothetical protein